MHEDGLGTGLGHQGGIHLIGGQVRDALRPGLHGLTHRDPHVGIEDVRALDGGLRILAELQHRPGLLGDGLALGHQLRLGEILLGGAGHEVHAHLGAAHHQGVAHVVAGVPQEDQLHPLELAEMLLDGEEVRQHLGGMKLVGEAVPHGDAGLCAQLLHDLLAEAPVLDAVVHPAQDPGGVGDALLLAHLGAGGPQIGDAHAQIVARHLKGAAGPGGVLLKEEDDVLALAEGMGDAGLLLGLQLRRQVQETADLLRREVQEFQKILALEIHSHILSAVAPRAKITVLLRGRSSAARSGGCRRAPPGRSPPG